MGGAEDASDRRERLHVEVGALAPPLVVDSVDMILIMSFHKETSQEDTLRAVRLHADGLKLEDVPAPVAGPGETVVRVHAAAITRDELSWFTDRLPAIPSYELSGVTEAGDEVIALMPFDRDGCAAELAVVPGRLLAPKPAQLSHVEAAALPMPGLTAWQALFEHGRLKRGERVLVLGAHGGVGHIAVQLAAWAGAEVVDDAPADLAFDTAGTVRPDGVARYVTVADATEDGIYFVVEPRGDELAEVARVPLQVEIDSVYPLERAGEAFDRVMSRGKHGKVVLDVLAA
jgi:NADPH:quinone reductase-like Zn-dependent oxidoreductase